MLVSNAFIRHAHPDIASLMRYCHEVANGEPMPRFSRFRANRVAPLLGYLFLLDVLPGDYRFRLCGERIVVLFGVRAKGWKLSEMGDAEMRASLRRTYDRVVASHLPLYLRGRYVWPDADIEIERLLIPMADDEGRLSTICGVAIPKMGDHEIEAFVGRGPARLVGEDELVMAA